MLFLGKERNVVEESGEDVCSEGMDLDGNGGGGRELKESDMVVEWLVEGGLDCQFVEVEGVGGGGGFGCCWWGLAEEEGVTENCFQMVDSVLVRLFVV